MHTFSETSAGVPAFLAKLWRLVEDPETNNLICWSKDGRSFIIQNQAQFARELLPLNYKHNNMASFIRQLNMYGFHKITSIDNGGLKFDRDEMEFTHPCFKRNCPYLLEHIKRKIASSKSVDEKSILKPEAVTKVLQDVKAMRGRQDSLDSRFSVMKQENEALWREIASLRQKHAKQQQIVNKLIQFLITIVQPQRNMTGVKRHMQLMINDTPNKSKMRRTSESDSECGPVIHELGEELLEEVSEIEPEIMVPNSPFTRGTTPATPTNDPDVPYSLHNTESPHSNISIVSQNFDLSNQDSDAFVAGAVVNDGLIQTVNNDGSKIFYHITEVPDVQPQDSNTNTVSYDDDNVLATPMVREEMARNQLLKQKIRQKRFKTTCSTENRVSDTLSSNNKEHNVLQPMLIKSEQDTAIDPMKLFNAYPNNRGLTPDPDLSSTNFSDDSRHSNSNTTGDFLISSTSSAKAELPADNVFLAGNSSDLYNPNNFITNDMPADIFEDNSLTSAAENRQVAESNNFNKAQNCLQPSTSAAAAAAAAAICSTNNSNDSNLKKPVATTIAPTTLRNENGRKMALTKLKNNQHLMRDDVSGHLDTVQDELEGLKDLLRSDVYSLDQNTLLGVSLSILNAHDDEGTNYEDAINITAGSNQTSISIESDSDDEVKQTRCNVFQFLNDLLNRD